MGYNKKILSEATKKLNKPQKIKNKNTAEVQNTFPIISSEGFLNGPPPPGANYRIPGNSIYNPTPYNILARGSNGQEKIIAAGDTSVQNFGDADYVDEFQIAKKGGEKKYSRSLSATNKLFKKNPLVKGKKKKNKKTFDPNAKYYQEGGYIDLDLDDNEILELQKGGYTIEYLPELTKAQKGRYIAPTPTDYQDMIRVNNPSVLNIGVTHLDEKGNPITTAKFYDYPPFDLSTKPLDIPKVPDQIIPIEPYKPQPYKSIRTANRSQTIMEPDPDRLGEFRMKELRQVPYSAYFPNEGWEEMNAPRVMYYNPGTGEETEERFDTWNTQEGLSFQKGGLIKAQTGINTEPELTYDAPETFGYANKDVEKKHKALLDKTRALMDTAQGRKLWYNELKPKDFSVKELTRFVKGVADYNKEAQAYEKAKRRMQEDKISTDTFAQLYNQRNWAKFDPATMKEGYKGQWQDAVNEAQKRKEANMGYTDAVLEFTGAPGLKRIINNPKGTLKGIANTGADIVMSGTPGVGSLFGAGNPTINPLTGNEYWSGLDETMDVLGVLPGIGAAGKLAKTTGVVDDISRGANYLTTQTPLRNAYKINPFAFKPNPKAYYRMIGKEGYADALESGVIRPPQTSRVFDQVSQKYIDIPIPAYEEAYYNAQYPLDKRWYPNSIKKINPKKAATAEKSGYQGPYMVEVTGNPHLFENAENVAAYTGPNASQTVTYSKEFIPTSTPGVKFYKEDWLRGYKPVEIPGQFSSLKSGKDVQKILKKPGDKKFTSDFEEATFLKPEESYFQPKTEFERELSDQAERYYRVATSPENIERARMLDQEFGTNYTKALQEMVFQRQNKPVADKYPFNIKVLENPGEGAGGYSSLTPEGAAKKAAEMPTTINDREIVIFSDSPVKDLKRRVSHELSHHKTLSQNNLKALENAWGDKLKNAIDNPGEISKTNPVLADKLIQPAFKNMPDSPTLYEYLSDPAEVDAYLNTNFRDELVNKGILKNHWDELTDNKLALYFMDEGSKDNMVNVLLDIIKPSEFLEIFNKGIYAIPATIGTGVVLGSQGNEQTYQEGGIFIDIDNEDDIQNYVKQGYIVEFDEGGFVPSTPVKFATPTPKKLPNKSIEKKEDTPASTTGFMNAELKFAKPVTQRKVSQAPVEEPYVPPIGKYNFSSNPVTKASSQPISGGFGSTISNTGKPGVINQALLNYQQSKIGKLDEKANNMKQVVMPTFWDKVSKSQAQAFQGPDVYKAADEVNNLVQQGQNYFSRQNAKTSDKKEPLVKPLNVNKETEIKNPIVTGDPIYLNDRRYYTQEVVDLNNVKLGYRNRNEYKDINTEAGNVTAFNPFTPKRNYNLSKIGKSETFIGIDKNGKFKSGTIDKFASDDLISKTFSNTVVDFVYNPDGTVKLEKRNKDNPNNPVPVVKVIDNGKEKIGSINFLTKSNVANPYSQYGEIQGGRIILKSGGKTILVSGSINDVVTEFKKLKEQTGKPVEFITLDNGSYNLGIRTKDKKITAKDLKEYDNLNNSGGNFLYLLSESTSKQFTPQTNSGFKPKSINDVSKVKVEKDLPDFSNLIDSPTARYFKKEIIDKNYVYGMSTDPLLKAKKATGKGLPGEKEIDCSGAICKVLSQKGVKIDDPTINYSAQNFHDRSKPVKWADVKDGDLITMRTSKGKVDHIGFLVIDKKTGKKFIAESSRSFNQGRIVPFKQRIEFLKSLYPDFTYSIRR